MRLWPRRKLYLDDLPRTHDLRFATFFLVGFVILSGALYGVGYVLAGDRVPSGTSVSGVDIGGMAAGEARAELRTKLVPLLTRRLQAEAAGRTFKLDPQESGLTLDIDATVDDALGGGPADPRHMLQVLTGGGEIEPIIEIDADELAVSLDEIDAAIRQEPVDATVTYAKFQPQVRYAKTGRALDRAQAAPRLRSALLAQEGKVSLPVKVLNPAITSTEATRFAEGPAQRALSGPVRLKVGEADVKLEPRVFGPALRLTATKTGSLALEVDADTLATRARSALASLPNRPVEARLYFRAGRPTIRPGRPGVSVTPEALARGVRRAIAETGAKRVARVEPETLQPRRTTEQVRQLRVSKVVVASRVRFRSSRTLGDPSSIARQLNGVLLRPGSTLQFTDRVDWQRHPRAASLVASATYDVAFRAGLTIVERTPLPYYLRSFQAGIDASVSEPGEALTLRNDGPYGVYLRAYVDQVGRRGSTLNVELWSTPWVRVTVRQGQPYDVVRPEPVVDRSRACNPRPGSAGFEIDVRRRITRGDGPGRLETVHSQYSPAARIICR